MLSRDFPIDEKISESESISLEFAGNEVNYRLIDKDCATRRYRELSFVLDFRYFRVINVVSWKENCAD